MKVLLVDNYDSFTYNIVHALRELGAGDVDVVRNTALHELRLDDYTAVVASPGPGLPAEAGQLAALVEQVVAEDRAYLGICLGHQALGEACGAELYALNAVRHGVEESCAALEESPLLAGLDASFAIGRYHSWAVDIASASRPLTAFAKTDDGVVQGMQVTGQRQFGLQFHPESIMTADAGPTLLRNFLDFARA